MHSDKDLAYIVDSTPQIDKRDFQFLGSYPKCNQAPASLLFHCSLFFLAQVVKYWSCAERNIPFPSKHGQTAGRSGSFYTPRWLCEVLVDVWRLFCLHPKFVIDPESPVPNLGVSRREIVEMLDGWQSKILSTTQDTSPINGIQLDLIGFNPAIRTCLYVFFNFFLHDWRLYMCYFVLRLIVIYPFNYKDKVHYNIRTNRWISVGVRNLFE